MADRRKLISRILTIAFLALVVTVLWYSLPIIVNWPPIMALIYLLLLYAILCPTAVVFIPSKFAYGAKIAASLLGLEMSIIFWLNLYGMLFLPNLLILVFVGFCALLLLHFLTRQGLVIYRSFLYGGLGLDLKRINQISGTIVEPLFLVMITSFSNPDFIKFPGLSALIVVSSLVGVYMAFSLLGLNVTYRAKQLDETLHTEEFSLKIDGIETRLKSKYASSQESINLVSFLLRSAMDDFIYGDYERSFLNSYRIINDKIIVDPLPVTRKKASEETLDEYRRIRVFLVHGFLQERKSKLETPINVSDVIWARKVLFKKTLDLIRLSFCVANEI